MDELGDLEKSVMDSVPKKIKKRPLYGIDIIKYIEHGFPSLYEHIQAHSLLTTLAITDAAEQKGDFSIHKYSFCKKNSAIASSINYATFNEFMDHYSDLFPICDNLVKDAMGKFFDLIETQTNLDNNILHPEDTYEEDSQNHWKIMQPYTMEEGYDNEYYLFNSERFDDELFENAVSQLYMIEQKRKNTAQAIKNLASVSVETFNRGINKHMHEMPPDITEAMSARLYMGSIIGLVDLYINLKNYIEKKEMPRFIPNF